MELRRITPPAIEPVTMIEAQNHLRAPVGGPDEVLIATYLQAAREAVEGATGRVLITQTWQYLLDAFPVCNSEIVIPKVPLLAVSEVRVIGDGGTESVIPTNQYQVQAPSGPLCSAGRILTAYGTNWPATQAGTLGAVRITFTAGYGATAASVPAALRSAIFLMLGELYENREASAPRAPEQIPAVDRLLGPFRVYWA